MSKTVRDYFLETGEYPNTRNAPKCIDCRYCVKCNDGIYRCHKITGVVSGEPVSCLYLRFADDLCGNKGQFFEERS